MRAMVLRLIFALCVAGSAVAPSAAQDNSAIPADAAQSVSRDAELAQFLDATFDEMVALDPEWMTQLGIPGANDRWTRRNEEAAAAEFDLSQRTLSRLKTFRPAELSTRAQLDLKVAADRAERIAAIYPWRHMDYAITHQYGVHTGLPAFLINQHQVKTREDAEDYLARLESIALPLDDVTGALLARADMGYAPPAFTFPEIISAARAQMAGAPFENGAEPVPLLADFTAKVHALGLPAEDRAVLLARAEVALLGVLGPALERLVAAVESISSRFTQDRGVVALDPSGGFYNTLLAQYTTTALTADDIHALGLRETARIHEEMRAVMSQVGFEGDLQAFFAFMRDDPQFLYPPTDDGRAAYLAAASDALAGMHNALPTAFATLPKAPLEVRRVEAFREASASKAFYMRPAPDGSRPAIFYANLHDMTQMPRYQIEALAFHEGVPGHHLQIAIAQELKDLPRIRKFGFYTAYSEGWGLYAERLAKDMGFYKDPYSDFGRLALELWRAGRLVTDTGLHAKGWSREEASQWLIANTPNSQSDCRSAIDRYLVNPGQATAYMIGSLKILELRARAEGELGDAYDIRAFHDAVLTNGPVPLSILEDLVSDYIAAKKGA